MFAASFEYQTQSVGKQLLELLRSNEGLASGPFDRLDGCQLDTVTLVQQSRWNTKNDRFLKPLTDRDSSGVYIVGWTRLDNQTQIKRKLALDTREALADNDLIRLAYLQWGVDFTEYLVGDFSCVIYDTNTARLIAVRDQIGARPLYCYQDNQRVIFADNMAIITRIESINKDYSSEWLARFIACSSSDSRQTPYRNISKIPPAHLAVCEQNKVHLSQYFDWRDIDPIKLASDQEYVEAYTECLNQAIGSRVLSEYPLVAESSGGLDSSSIICLGAKALAKPERDLICMGFANATKEVARAREVSDNAGVSFTQFFNFHELYTPERRLSEAAGFSQHAGMPNTHADAVSYAPLLDAAKNTRARTILSGYGGDQFVTYSGDYVLRELIDTGQFNLWHKRRGGRWLRNYLAWCRQRLIPVRKYDQQAGLNYGFSQEFVNQRFQYSILKPEIEREHRVRHYFSSAQPYSNSTTVNEHLLADIWSEYGSIRLEDCSLSAARRGMEYRWPLLDRRLISLYLSFPCEQKLGPNMAKRYLHARAMAGQLPPNIVDKHAQGRTLSEPGTSPFDFSSLLSTNDIEPELHSLIDESAVARSIDLYQKNASTVGNKAWLIRLLILNRWLRMNKQSTNRDEVDS